MAEKQEGLEADEVLDELDVEVPTAAFELIKGLENGESTAFYYGYDPRTSLSGGIYEEVNELVRREDHREALVEAVQQAQERERRRNLKKIQEVFDKYENGETPFDRYERAALRPFVQDLEEEVEE